MTLKSRTEAGFTYIELLVTAMVLLVLASVAVPMYKWEEKRRKEVRLRTYLEQTRAAIDLYKQYVDEGRILLEDVDQMGYPPDLATLVEGVTVSSPVLVQPGEFQGETAEGRLIKFLIREPVDPITGEPGWGMRSYQDRFDSSSWGGENLYDIYSLSDKMALDRTYYKDW